MVERKIIQVDDSSPLVSRKKRVKAAVGLGVFVLIIGIVIAIILLSASTRVKKVGNLSITKVEKGSLTTSTEASGSVVLPTQVSIVSMETGYSEEVYVEVGDKVLETTILAKLDVPSLEQDLVDVENSLITEKIQLEEAQLNLEYSIKELNIKLQRVEKDILEAEKNLLISQELKNLKSSRESDYEESLEVLESLNNDREDILLSIEKTTKQGNLSIRSKQAQISQYETNSQRISDSIEEASIKSPISGTVISINETLKVPGSLISQGTELFTVANTDDVYIDLEVYEEYRTALKVGGIMEILISSKVIEAEIIHIGSVASLSSDSLAATVVVRAKPIGDSDLTSGASAVASIPLGTKEDALLLPRGAYLTTGLGKYVYKIDGDMAYKTSVSFGSIDGSEVEVLSGLEAGDKIVISSYQSFIDQDVIELK